MKISVRIFIFVGLAILVAIVQPREIACPMCAEPQPGDEVCGSDGKTSLSHCLFLTEHCMDEPEGVVYVAHKGKCNPKQVI